MHNLPELIDRCKIITLNNLEKLEISVLEALESSSSTIYVKTIQSISLQKSIFLIGSISIYESIFQETLKCNNGFDEVKKILNKNNDSELLKRFEEVIYIINILKHGKGRSYSNLLKKSTSAKLKNDDEKFFVEGDISEISTLIEVNNELIESCLMTMSEIWNIIQKTIRL